MNIDELSRFVKTTVAKISITISLMQLKGLVVEEGGKCYLRGFESG